MALLRELLGRQERVVTTQHDLSVREAAKEMARANVGCVAVLEGELLVGIFTERDILKRVLLADLVTDDVQVSEVMTREIVTADPDQDVRTAQLLMREHHIRHLPVVDSDGRLLGVLSIRDLISNEMDEIRRYLHLEEG